MELGENIEIEGKIWVAVKYCSTKNHKKFELWNKEGKRMAYVEVIND